MTHVIAEPCIPCEDAAREPNKIDGLRGKYTDCVTACPVDCIHPYPDGPKGDYNAVNQLYIDPAECIDCGACVPACPVVAIFPEPDLPAKYKEYTQINADYFATVAPARAERPAKVAAVAAAAPGKKPAPAAAAARKKEEPAKAPERKPLALKPEDMYKPLGALRPELAGKRGQGEVVVGRQIPGRERRYAAYGAVAAFLLLFTYAVVNNLAKFTNNTLYGQLSFLAAGGAKPSLGPKTYSLARRVGGDLVEIRVTDSVFGSRELSIKVPVGEWKEALVNMNEAFFGEVEGQMSRFYLIFVDRRSDGTLDEVIKTREFWSDGGRFLGRYQQPMPPEPPHQELYAKTVESLARALGLASPDGPRN